MREVEGRRVLDRGRGRAWLSLAACLMLGAVAYESQGAESAPVGNMECVKIPHSGLNLIIHSSAHVRCTFKGSEGSEQWYMGETGIGLGIDLKWSDEERIYYGVLSSSSNYAPEGDFLSGKFGGVGASAAAGVGVGAAVLIGGSNDTLALQPAVETSTGIGAAGGLRYLTLQSDPLNKARIATPRGKPFADTLYAGYFDRAYAAYHLPDYEGSDFFSERAIEATGGRAPAPVEATQWKMSSGHRDEVAAGRKRLMAALGDPISASLPVDAARAQVNFDCWVYGLSHQAELETVVPCREDFYAALKKVEVAMAEERAAVAAAALLMQPGWFTVYFATDSARLDADAQATVAAVIAKTEPLTKVEIFVGGNTDRAGSAAYNQVLSEKRAASVVEALLGAGARQEWIVAKAFGDTRPVVISANPHSALNRRVDIGVKPIEVDVSFTVKK